jgi:hypothetical protein
VTGSLPSLVPPKGTGVSPCGASPCERRPNPTHLSWKLARCVRRLSETWVGGTSVGNKERLKGILERQAAAGPWTDATGPAHRPVARRVGGRAYLPLLALSGHCALPLRCPLMTQPGHGLTVSRSQLAFSLPLGHELIGLTSGALLKHAGQSRKT